jgi:hypothetical protein
MGKVAKMRRDGPGQNLALEKGLPANIDAERFILGSVLLDDARFIDIAGTVSSDDFALEKHRRIFGRMKELHESGEKIDRVTVANELLRWNELESVDGLSYLVSLDDGLPHISNLDSYVRIVREKATLRKIVFAARHTMNRALLAEEDPGTILAGAEETLLRIGGARTASTTVEDLPAVAALQDPVSYIREPELPTGAVIGLTGDSGSGKSTLATAWVRDAIATGRPALILDRESPRSIALDRMARLGLVDGPLLRWAGGWNADETLGPDAPAVISWVRASDPKPLVIVDSLAAFLIGGDENSAGDMRRFMHSCRRLADTGACVAIIHHDGKSDTAKDFRGSSDYKASLDQAFHVTNIGPDLRLDRIRLRCFKSRFGLCAELIYHYAGGRMVADERTHAPEKVAVDKLTSLLRLNPCVTSTRFESLAVAAGLGRNSARDFINNGVVNGFISRKSGPNRAQRHTLIESAGERYE